MVQGVVREWDDEEGWGVLESDETPGGCWAHFSTLDISGFCTVEPGQHVTFTFERVQQDGFGYRALHVNVDGVPPDDYWETVLGPSEGHRSSLVIEPDGAGEVP